MNRVLPYVILAMVILFPLAVDAQGFVGGAPEAGITAFVAWMQGPFGRPIITLLFMGIGIVLAAGRHTFEGIIFGVLGAAFYVGSGGLSTMMTGNGG